MTLCGKICILGSFWSIGSLVVFLYDEIITTGEEIRYFWRRRVTGAAILFWLNKYMAILDSALYLGTYIHSSDKVGFFQKLSSPYH